METDGRRVVLVTGGSRGIGRAVVDLLAARGERVVSTSRSAPVQPRRLGDRPGSGGVPGEIVTVHYELGNAASAENAVEQTKSLWGRLDGVVANAGFWAGGRLSSMSPATWSEVLRANVEGVAQLSRASLPLLARSSQPSITIVSSVVGLIGGPGDTAYASAKAALCGFGRSLAKEVADDGIRVNVVAPGFVETDMTAEVTTKSRDRIANSILLGRFGSVEEVASAAVFLSEDATYCTGSILTVDGGWSI